MTAGAAEPRERFVRLAAAVRQRRQQLANLDRFLAFLDAASAEG